MNSTKKISFITIFIGIYCLHGSFTFQCHSTDKCSCAESSGIEFEFQCPIYETEIDIKVNENAKTVEIQCRKNTAPYLDINLLPEFDAHDTTAFYLKYCYSNTSFSTILNQFNVTNPTTLVFQSGAPENDDRIIEVSKELLEGLDTLEILTFSYSTLQLEPDFLQATPNLLRLALSRGGLSEIRNYFRFTPKLRLLDLTRNQIGYLPEGVFQDLVELQKLFLWNNNLTGLTKNMFTGLQKLTLLELMSNHIEEVAEDAFSELTSLVNISLRSNNIKQVHSDTFKFNTMLENIRLGLNPNLNVSKYVFANLTNLQTVELSECNFQRLPGHLFDNSVNLKDIKLKRNLLMTLPETLFDGLKNLKKLDLSDNDLSLLSSKVFHSLENLEELDLGNNKMSRISDALFQKLGKLKYLDLRNNRINYIDLNAFSGPRSLISLDLSFNQWDLEVNESYIAGLNPLNNLSDLEVLLLHHNTITGFPELYSWQKLRKMDLSFNSIEEVEIHHFARPTELQIEINLANNKIRTVNFFLAESLAIQNLNESKIDLLHYSGASILIDINNNPVTCDCTNFDLIKYNNDLFSPVLSTFVTIRQDQLYCSKSKVLVKTLKPLDVSCPMTTETGCPEECSCSYRPYDLAVLVDCSFKNLTSYPVFKFMESRRYNFNQTMLDLSGNSLLSGPLSNSNYDNLTSLDLSRNQIVEFSWIPPNMRDLNLNRNRIKKITGKVVDLLKNTTSLQRLNLKNNPWVCDCDAVDLQKYLMQYYKTVQSNDVRCENTKAYLVKLHDLCRPSLYLTVVLPIVLSVLLCFAVAIALYFRYQTEIKIYLYAKNLCLWFVTEDELDKDKTYDVFVSYSNQDEKFVVEHLLPELEHGEHPFKVCIHIRDWVPGEFISKQVVNSVKDSRRTLVVLSNNFVESDWGKLEFRTAHTEAISEGRARVIVVIYGDVDDSKLDNELKSYLKTNTYVKWGDRYFWNKLKYALPHSKNFYDRNKKHAKVMLKIDDKFELITSPPTPNHMSTPPITLDPSLLKDKEVKLDIPAQVEGEAPLLVRQS